MQVASVRRVSAPILIAFDGSPSSHRAVEATARLLGPRPAIVLHVWEPVVPVPPADPFSLSSPVFDPEQLEDVNGTIRAHATALAEEGARIAAEAGLTAEGVAEESHGSIWATILDVAGGRGAELVVVGARGLSPMRSLLLGGVSNGVVHHAHLPVLVLPAPAEEAAAGS